MKIKMKADLPHSIVAARYVVAQNGTPQQKGVWRQSRLRARHFAAVVVAFFAGLYSRFG